eukprot:4064277-Pyramimonas_sp.AAC.1
MDPWRIGDRLTRVSPNPCQPGVPRSCKILRDLVGPRIMRPGPDRCSPGSARSCGIRRPG